MRIRTLLVSGAAAMLLAGCATTPSQPTVMQTPAVFPQKTATQAALNELPAPARPITVAVYGFADQTGQFKLTDTGQNLSRAVSQGGSSILIKALQDAGQRQWFTVLEREQLKNLLTERQIITEMRGRYLGETTVNPQALPAMLFAGVILEGGIISYDTNTVTGGAGAAILGVGADAKYKQDNVTVYIRAISVKTGEILTSVTASKAITSRALHGNVFAYVASDKVLEGEVGYTKNEPGQIALQQAIEKAVYALVMEGADQHLWSFADPQAAYNDLARYRQERDGVISAEQMEGLRREARQAHQKKSTGDGAAAELSAVTPTRPPKGSDPRGQAAADNG
jgi:curli production assembly/transport component CsgG